ncbi:TonB-dependent receptor domain-containing protein [candidate division KSB1 bacterium]
MKTCRSSFLVKLILISALLIPSALYGQGKILGVIKNRRTGEPLENANVVIVGSHLGSATDNDGKYEILNIPEGVYTIEASYVGYEKESSRNVRITRETVLELDFNLIETSHSLSEVVVSASHFSIMKSAPGSKVSLTSENIKATALYGGDIYRAVTRLPGITGSDYSSKFTVRGGEYDEVLVLFDGIELYDPFHIKDFGGVLSIIDVEAIKSVDILTGGFPAEYGKKNSGVFNLRSGSGPLNEMRTSIGLSMMNGRILSEGPINDDKGRWLFSARRGFIDFALKLTGDDDELIPEYYDVLGKFEYELSKNHTASLHFLRAGDKLKYVDDNNENSNSGYNNTYFWLNLKSYLGDRVNVTTTVSSGLIDHERDGELLYSEYEGEEFFVNDHRNSDFAGIKQDWGYQAADWLFLKGGYEYKNLSTDYNYSNRKVGWTAYYGNQGGLIWESSIDSTNIGKSVSGDESAYYLSGRIRLMKPLIIETGIRYDRQSYIGKSTVSPRLNVSYSITENTVLKAGWGKFYQAQNLYELNIPDADSTFYKSEKSEHIIANLEHQFDNGMNLVLGVYRKNLSQIRPRYKNFYNTIDVFPEASGDRISYLPHKGTADGIELMIKNDTGGKISWWGSYVFSEAFDHFSYYKVPKLFHQKHTIDFNLNYRPDDNWRFNLSWIYHTGWPFTDATVSYQTEYFPGIGKILYTKVRVVPERYNSERLPDYHRMDLRLTRNFKFRNGNLGVFFEVINAYDRRNIRNVEYSVGGGETTEEPPPFANRIDHHWLRFLPSIGFTWDR